MTCPTAFESRSELQSIAAECAVGNCYKYTWKYGPIAEWDVSHVSNMVKLFYMMTAFNGDISKWDVSKVTDMSSMFYGVKSFNGDISKWDVSSVTTMGGMFNGAESFNSDISKWDVSKVTDMGLMFNGAKSFNHKLCGDAWVNSEANKGQMFDGSSGSICGLCSIIIIAILFLKNPVSSSSQRHIMSNLHLSSSPLSLCSRLPVFNPPALFTQVPMHSPPNPSSLDGVSEGDESEAG